MKIACTTLACPTWDLDTIVRRFKEYGYEGLDFRGLRMEMELWKMPEFTTDLTQSVRKVAQSGLPVTAFSSSARMFAKDAATRQKHLDEVTAYAGLCRAFSAPMIRVFGGPLEGTPRDQAIEMAAAALAVMARAVGEGITLVVETHDEWIESKHLAAVLKLVNLPNVKALWDLHHPYRMLGETPRQTYDSIGKWVASTHLKDSRKLPDGKHRYCLGGRGDVPMGEMVSLLRQGGYDGYLTLEWEKRWIPDLEEPEVALPQYAAYMKSL